MPTSPQALLPSPHPFSTTSLPYSTLSNTCDNHLCPSVFSSTCLNYVQVVCLGDEPRKQERGGRRVEQVGGETVALSWSPLWVTGFTPRGAAETTPQSVPAKRGRLRLLSTNSHPLAWGLPPGLGHSCRQMGALLDSAGSPEAEQKGTRAHTGGRCPAPAEAPASQEGRR